MATPYKIFVTTSATDSAAPTTNGTAVTSTNTYYSKMWTGEDAWGYDLHVEWTGTPTGTLSLWVSDKLNPDETTDNDWVTSTEVTLTNPAGSASKFRVATNVSPAYRKRLKYVNASGSGTLFGYVVVPKQNVG
jgi:hypothetical protein